jgi:hypothetical protein
MSRELNIARSLLLITGVDSLRQEILELNKSGVLNSDFRTFLEECADGRRVTSISASIMEALLRQILMMVFIPPAMPAYLRKLYDDKITDVLNPPNASRVEEMLAKFKEDGLLSQAFAELFLHRLNEFADKGHRLAASSYWDLCRENLSEEVLASIDRWLG